MIDDKYNFTKRVPGKHDCLTMMLEHVGDTETLELIVGKYRSIGGGLKRLPAITGFGSIHEYLIAKGWTEITMMSVQDNDLVIQDGCHCSIYFYQHLLGVGDDEMFGIRRVKAYETIEGVRVYRRP